MKKSLLVLFMLLILVAVFGQELMPWQYIRHSARTNEGYVHFRFNALDQTLTNNEFHYRTGTGNWILCDVQDLGELEYEAQVPYEPGNEMNYRLRSQMSYEGQEIVILDTSVAANDAFPPAADDLAQIAVDPEGDTEVESANMLDITETCVASTDNKIHSVIANLQGSFPTMNSLTSYNLYMTTIINPETAITDSTVYAMVYTFNIPGVISTGLYKLGVDAGMNPVFEQLGSIQSQVTGGKLYMACNMDDLTSDPSFGAWPNLSHALALASVTIRVNVDLSTMEPELLFGDYSSPAMVIFNQRLYQAQTNTLPMLENIAVTPVGQEKLVSVDYSDADEDFPLFARLVLESGDEYPLLPSLLDYSESVLYSVRVPEEEELLGAYLSFSDNASEFVNLDLPITSIEDQIQALPGLSVLLPNPIRSFGVPIQIGGLKNGGLTIEIYNLKGQKLGKIHETENKTQELRINWDGRVGGQHLSSGLYFMKIRQTGMSRTVKFAVLK